MNKVDQYFKEKNEQYLLLMIKFEYSSKNCIFGKFVSDTASPTVLPVLEGFFDEMGAINTCYFFDIEYVLTLGRFA